MSVAGIFPMLMYEMTRNLHLVSDLHHQNAYTVQHIGSAFPMARLAKRQGYRPLSASQSLGCLEARCLEARCLVACCLGLQTSLEAELYLRAVTSGGR